MQTLTDFPKIECPFIRKTYKINADDFKKHGRKLQLRDPEVYLATDEVNPGFEWVFDDPDTMPDEMQFTDLGDGEFEITAFSMGDADFGTIEGTYDIDGDTMTITFSGTASFVDDYSGDYMEAELSETVNFVRA